MTELRDVVLAYEHETIWNGKVGLQSLKVATLLAAEVTRAKCTHQSDCHDGDDTELP